MTPAIPTHGNKRVPSHVTIGPNGEHCVTRGYTEICGVRFYDDHLVVGSHGQLEISPGWIDYGNKGEV